MQATLTITAAKELGRLIRLYRMTHSLTLRDVAKASGLSPQYVQNIERGERTTVSEDAYTRLAKGLGFPEDSLLDMLLRARVTSALEQRGIDQADVAFVWVGVEQRLHERGIDLHLDMTKILADVLS